MVMCCPLQGNDGDGPSCSNVEVRKARKEHVCGECREPIARGTKYEYATGVWDGRPDTFKTCLMCVEIRDHFACEGWIYEQLWNDLEENFFPDMAMGGPCMAGLSPDAKLKLVEARMTWYFDQGEIDDSAWEDWPKHRDRQKPIRTPVVVEEKVSYYDTPEYYWKRELELDAFRDQK